MNKPRLRILRKPSEDPGTCPARRKGPPHLPPARAAGADAQRPRVPLGVRIAIVIILCTCFAAGLPGAERALADPQDPQAAAPVLVYRVGATREQIPEMASRDVEVTIDYLFTLMNERRNIPNRPKTRIFPNLDALKQAVLRGELDVVVLLARDYLALRDELALEPVLFSVRNDDELVRFALYAARNRHMTSLEQLRGGRVIFDGTEGGSLGRLWFESLLLRQNIDPAGFASFESVARPSRAVLPVFFGQADACVIAVSIFDATAGLNPQIGNELEILHLSPPVAVGLLCFTDRVDPSRKEDLLRGLLSMHGDPDGRRILALFRRDRIVPFHQDAIQPIEDLELERNALLARRASNSGD
jgi:ABC-type phosphate/phosphonate transport system substrate-binding protein